jgi:hypothetical protein
MPTVSIDQQVGQLAPWDLTLTIDGQPYQTTPPTIGALAVLQDASDESRGVKLDTLIEVVESLFHIKPPVRTWPLDKLFAVVEAVMGYWATRVKKTPAAPAAATPGRAGTLPAASGGPPAEDDSTSGR